MNTSNLGSEFSAEACLLSPGQVPLNAESFTSDVINCIINIPTSIAAIFGNLLVLLSIWNTPSLHSPSHVLLFGLAIADFGVCLLVQPLFVAFSISKINGKLDVTCTGMTLVLIGAYFLCCISLLTLTAISLDRLLAIRLHLRYKVVVTTKRVICLLVGIWLYSATAISFLLKNRTFFLVHYGTLPSLCICLMSFCYLSIFRVARRHQKQVERQQRQLQAQEHGQNSLNLEQLKKSSFARFQICFLFLLCYLPLVLVIGWIAKTGRPTVATQLAFKFSSTLVLISSCMNPVMYCWRLQEMRVAFRQTLRKCCFLFGADSYR